MALVRSIVAFALLALWSATPVLACLPNSEMDDAEMECCKNMVGDCQMGTSDHPCCKTSPTVSAVAAVHAIWQFQPEVAAVALTATCEPDAILQTFTAPSRLGLPPPAPPGLNSILRI